MVVVVVLVVVLLLLLVLVLVVAVVLVQAVRVPELVVVGKRSASLYSCKSGTPGPSKCADCDFWCDDDNNDAVPPTLRLLLRWV